LPSSSSRPLSHSPNLHSRLLVFVNLRVACLLHAHSHFRTAPAYSRFFAFVNLRVASLLHVHTRCRVRPSFTHASSSSSRSHSLSNSISWYSSILVLFVRCLQAHACSLLNFDSFVALYFTLAYFVFSRHDSVSYARLTPLRLPGFLLSPYRPRCSASHHDSFACFACSLNLGPRLLRFLAHLVFAHVCFAFLLT